jgi:hypothetical protein
MHIDDCHVQRSLSLSLLGRGWPVESG